MNFFEHLLKYFAAVLCMLLAWPFIAHTDAIQLPKTGQSTCYDAAGAIVACAGTGQDAEKQAGATLPSPRFTDNKNGTVIDNLTGLIWLKDANCTDTVGGIARPNGLLNWPSALTWSNNLASGKCDLSDNSIAGDWRLPNVNELRSLVDYSRHDPALTIGHTFSNVQSNWYWSSTSNPVYTAGAYTVSMGRGSIHVTHKLYGARGSGRVGNKIADAFGVWPVRDAK